MLLVGVIRLDGRNKEPSGLVNGRSGRFVCKTELQNGVWIDSLSLDLNYFNNSFALAINLRLRF
jgi:hypothetical protein